MFEINSLVMFWTIDHVDVLNSKIMVAWIHFPGWHSYPTLRQFINGSPDDLAKMMAMHLVYDLITYELTSDSHCKCGQWRYCR